MRNERGQAGDSVQTLEESSTNSCKSDRGAFLPLVIVALKLVSGQITEYGLEEVLVMVGFWTRFLNLLRSMFGLGASKKTLAAVSPEELRRERIRIEQTESKITREIEELEQKKQEFFAKGAKVGSERQRLQLARKIRELDLQVQARDRQLALIAKNLRVINGVAQLKENERQLRDLGMEGLVNQMDLAEVEAFVEKATVEGQFQMEKFTKLLGAIDEAEQIYQSDEESPDIMAIAQAMESAGHAESEAAVAEGLRHVEETIRSRMVTVND